MKAGWYYKQGTSSHFFKKDAAVSICGMMKREGTSRDTPRFQHCSYGPDCTRCWAKREGTK